MPPKILNINNEEDSEAIRRSFKEYIKIEQEHYKLLPIGVKAPIPVTTTLLEFILY